MQLRRYCSSLQNAVQLMSHGPIPNTDLSSAAASDCRCLTREQDQVRSAIIRIESLSSLFRGAVLVDSSITLHTVEGFFESHHHGVSQLFGL